MDGLTNRGVDRRVSQFIKTVTRRVGSGAGATDATERTRLWRHSVGDDLATSNVDRSYSLAATSIAIFTFILFFLHPMLERGEINAAERVNDFETPTSRIYCRASSGAVTADGGLIHTAIGGAGGSGGLRTNRSGCRA